MKKILLTILAAIALSPLTASAIPVTVPSATAPGDILYGLSSGRYTILPIGAEGTCLGVSVSLPAYITCSTGGGGAGTWSTTTSTVSGQLINYTNNTTDIAAIGSNSTTTAEFFFDPNTNRFIVASGNVGIGTTTPLYPLVIRRPGGSGALGITINNDLSASGRDATFRILPDIAASFLGGYLFKTNNAASGEVDAMAILASGNIGIATTTPAAKLHTTSTDGGTYPFAISGNTKGMRVITSSVGTSIQGVDSTLVSSYNPLSIDGSVVTIKSNGTTEAIKVDSNQNIGLGSTTPGTKLSIGNTGNDTINISPTATSTFGSGINLRTGCFAVGDVCISGGGGGSANPTITTTLPFTNCEAQTDSYDFAPGGAYIQPIYGATFTNGTSSAIACDLTIPDNVSATPNGVIMPHLTATTTGNSVFEVNATTTSIGQNWIPTSYTNLLASTSAASRIAVTGGANYPLTSTTTISTNALNIVAGSILKVRFVNYHADANDTVENDLFMPKAVYKFDIKIN